jgi:hypothetical protein
MKKGNYVDVFSDRPYYIVEIVDGKIEMKECWTNSLTNVIQTLKEIKNMNDSAILMSACYRQYEGSYNVIVNPKEQYEKIYEYGSNHYKTFHQKFCEV